MLIQMNIWNIVPVCVEVCLGGVAYSPLPRAILLTDKDVSFFLFTFTPVYPCRLCAHTAVRVNPDPMNLIRRIQNSFAAKLSFYVLLFTILIFLAIFFSFYLFASRTIREAAEDKAVNLLEITKLEIENVFTAVKTAPENLLWAVVEKGGNPDSLYGYTRQIIEHNPYVFGTAVAFEPYYFKDKGYYFSPYSFRDGEHIGTIQLGTEDYDYFSMDWYATPKKLGHSYWSEPYFDEGGGQMLMVTYSIPVREPDGTFIGIQTVDVSLGWLTDLINGLRPYPSAFTLLVSRDGTYIVHPNKDMILNMTIFSLADSLGGDPEMRLLGERMTAGETGMVEMKSTPFGGDAASFAFFTPLISSDWSLCMVIHKKDVFDELKKTNTRVIVLIIVGLLLLFVFCMAVVRKLTKPLSLFSVSARRIARGDFDAPLPDIRSRDEMGELHSSFRFMQEHLTGYIEQLKETTTTKERIESELRIARDIQMGMIPKIFPPFPDRDDVDLYAVLKPAKEVGGDLYDFFIDSGRLFFAIGDVSGKGVPASLFMAVTRSLFRSVAAFYGDPADILVSMNASISETNDSNMFVTLFIGILDLDNGNLRYCNAGHNPPVVIGSDKRVEFLKVLPNLPAGLFPDFPYTSQETVLERGATLFLYTDGLTEAENGSKELYGEQRLLNVLVRTADAGPKEIIETVITDIDRHVAGAEQSDDLTILTIKILMP